MNRKPRRIFAIFEVLVLTFVAIPFLTLSVYGLFPTFESWQTETACFPFPVFVYVVMAGTSWLAILLRRKKLADYGIHFREIKYQLDIATACFIPVVLANLPFGMGLDHKTWSGALVLTAVNIGLLFALALILRRKPTVQTLGVAVAGIILISPTSAAESTAGKAIVLFLTYALFVGFGEEILYRGYMQSRLNEVFGRPHRFFGVPFGWGVIIASLLFGLTHVGILRWMLGLNTEVTLAWGFWTTFSGLALGFVREKSAGILAPALLHGLPQAIASVAMLFL